ncbi:MAG: TolC family protein [Planctomycetes bacterium]|nr:TolC family protein [Planctomycetota bacterium]
MNALRAPATAGIESAFATPFLALFSACALLGCVAPTPIDVAPEQAIAERSGLTSAVEFQAVGPDGGPIDEPDRVGDALSFADAIRRAVATDPSLQSALARVRIAIADADQARLLPNPVLDIVVRFGGGAPQVEASIAQQLIEAIQRPTRASAADHRLREAAAATVTTALDVISAVQESYIDAQASAALRPLLEQRLNLVERLVSIAKARLDVGEGTRGDVVTLDAQRAELLVLIDRAQLEERTHRLELARLVGEPSSAAGWLLDAWTAPALIDRPESAWVEAGLRARPEIQAITWRLAALGDDEALLRLLPWQGASAGIDAQRDGDWSVGPSISAPVPIFDSGQARRARLTAEQLESRHELTLARRIVVEEVRVAYQTVTASRFNLARVRDELVPLQRQRRQLAEDSFRAGQTDSTPLFLAEQDLRIAQTQAIEAEARAALALVRLQRAVGGKGVAESLAVESHPPPGTDRLDAPSNPVAPSPSRMP